MQSCHCTLVGTKTCEFCRNNGVQMETKMATKPWNEVAPFECEPKSER